jgi:hypothetical protein
MIPCRVYTGTEKETLHPIILHAFHALKFHPNFGNFTWNIFFPIFFERCDPNFDNFGQNIFSTTFLKMGVNGFFERWDP